MTTADLLHVEGLTKFFPIRGGVLNRVRNHVKAVDGVTFGVRRGEVVGLVGESGSGKTTVGRLILRLDEATAGTVTFDGTPLGPLDKGAMRRFRKRMQIIFQDPYASLNPREKIRGMLGHALALHGIGTPADREARMVALLEQVGLSADYLDRYPHEFSGGQRQRIGIARALALQPKFIVCDEPVSALDVSIQSQVLNILKDLQGEFGLTYLFIAHNLSVVEHISDRVAVMYLGKVVELADREALYREPLHPYTKALLSAIPIPHPKIKRERTILKGDVPSPLNPPSGCRFHTRCPIAVERCSQEEPEFREARAGHWVACWLVE
jgi:oligopeptide/dipeptide ABC transporter, ATP-binding protein, C-terminal domain